MKNAGITLLLTGLLCWIALPAPAQNPSEHWSFSSPRRPLIPPVRRDDWPRNPIDRFVLARLEKEGLPPSSEADRKTLIRRLSFDLTGLPPDLEDVEAFLADKNPDAYDRVVDRLLASPEYGERMALDWLDGARYADTFGFHEDWPREMWAWRDWVIQSFNTNMPFDRFTIEQLAGDLLPDATRKQKVATGFTVCTASLLPESPRSFMSSTWSIGSKRPRQSGWA